MVFVISRGAARAVSRTNPWCSPDENGVGNQDTGRSLLLISMRHVVIEEDEYSILSWHTIQSVVGCRLAYPMRRGWLEFLFPRPKLHKDRRGIPSCWATSAREGQLMHSFEINSHLFMRVNPIALRDRDHACQPTRYIRLWVPVQ